MTLTVTEPIAITPAMVTHHGVSALDPSPLWVSGSTYAKGDLAHRAETHYVYRRINAGSGTAAPEDDTANWQRLRPVNKYAMWDFYKSTPTRFEGADLVVKFVPGKRVDTLAVYGATGTAVTVECKVSGATIYGPEIRPLQKRFVSGWLDWFTAPFTQVKATAFTDLPMVSGMEITVTITQSGGVAACQYMVCGRAEPVGGVEWDPQDTGTNFSKIEREFDGSLEPGVSLIPRRTVPKAVMTVIVPAANVNRARALRERLNAVPALWNGISDKPFSNYYESVLIFGIYRNWDFSPSNVHFAKSALEVEEI